MIAVHDASVGAGTFLNLGITEPRTRILIVDDERDNRRLLSTMLASEDFDLLTAESGEEALAMVAEQPPDLILLDILMSGIDGYEVATRLKGEVATSNIPVIMLTSLRDHPAMLHGLSTGAEEFLSKPVERAELCMRVRNLLRLKEYGDSHDRHSHVLEAEVSSRSADLIASEELYQETFDAAPIGIVHVGLDGRWLRVNQRLCDLLGYSRAELLSAAVHGPLQSESVPNETASVAALTAGTIDHYVIDETSYHRRDGSVMWGRVNISLHGEPDGGQYFIWVIEDITERRSLEAQLRQTSKMNAVGRLASGVAHDCNNLLTVIIGFAELVRMDAVTSTRHGGELQEIVNAGRSAAGLTRQLLAFGREQEPMAAPLDMNRLITDMTAMFRRLIGEHIAVTLALAPRLPLVFADQGQLEQVVMTLVVNARDAMPLGGTLTFTTAEVDLDGTPVHEEAMTPGRYVVLAITGTGGGMSEETQRRAFEPFFTTQESGKGTGLGLSTTYGIVKQSRGYIHVDPDVGHGTTVKVYLPSLVSAEQSAG